MGWYRRLVAVVAVGPLLAGCGDDEHVTPAAEATTTTVAGQGSDIESLSYLLQGLLTTSEIGGGWVDQGRVVIPPGSNTRSGVLCADGDAIVQSLGSRFEPQVSTSFRQAPAGLPSMVVGESLLWGDRAQLTEDFATLVSAFDACTDGDGVERLADPMLGSQSAAFAVPGEAAPGDPWMDIRTMAILLADPNVDTAVVVSLDVVAIHDPPDIHLPEVTDEEWLRITGLALDRIEAGL